ncbi:MAG: hypothetical protein ACJ8CB_34410 [Ktedonobacteraceae bacterium]
MTTTERSMVVGVFTDHGQANQAIDALRNAGFNADQIRLVERGTVGFLDSLKSLFTGPETTTASTADDFVKMGVPESDARFYENEIEAGHIIVIVKSTGHQEQALSILRQSGAYDITARLRTQPGAHAGTYNPNVPPRTAPTGAPGPNVPPGTPPAGTYNPNVPPGANKANVPPGTYNQNAAPGTQPGAQNPDVSSRGYNSNVDVASSEETRPLPLRRENEPGV